jgi:hypothetical protein
MLSEDTPATPVAEVSAPLSILSALSGGLFISTYLTEVNYTATETDVYIGATDEDVIITFPSGIPGKVYIVKNHSRGNIVVRGSAGQKLDSAGNKTLGSNASLIAVFDGSRWNLI